MTKSIISAVAVLGVLFLNGCSVTESTAKEKPKYTQKEGSGPNGAIVVIDGKPYTESELMGDANLDYIEALGKTYDLRVSRIGKLLLDKEYGDLAKKENMSVEEYVDKKVIKDVKVTDADIKKFAEEMEIPKDKLEQVKDRIKEFLGQKKKAEAAENHIAKLTQKKNIELYFPKPPKFNPVIGDAPVFGKKDSKVTVVEFSDFQCPYCSKGAKIVQKLKKDYGSKIQFAFKQFPLENIHPNARPAAEASMCANEQGSDKFWTYHDKLFAAQDKLDAEGLKAAAKTTGLNMDKFNQCVESKKYAKYVSDDIQYGLKIGVQSTPTFLVNGKLIQGARPYQEFKELIEQD